MPAPVLRLFNDQECSAPDLGYIKPETVPVSLGDIVPLLMHAALSERMWLEDFAEETLEISQDLYEILLAYQPMANQQRRTAS